MFCSNLILPQDNKRAYISLTNEAKASCLILKGPSCTQKNKGKNSLYGPFDSSNVHTKYEKMT
jgi:hypothetical protein